MRVQVFEALIGEEVFDKRAFLARCEAGGQAEMRRQPSPQGFKIESDHIGSHHLLVRVAHAENLQALFFEDGKSGATPSICDVIDDFEVRRVFFQAEVWYLKVAESQ